MEDIVNSLEKELLGKSGFDLKLLIETKFMRDNPIEAKEASGNQTKSLNLNRRDDCQTM